MRLHAVSLLAALVLAAAAAAQAPPPRTSWEYKVLNRGQIVDKGSLNDGLNKLGVDGWELVEVVVTNPNQPGLAEFVFKRPRQATPVRQGNTKIYKLKNASARETARMLLQVFEGKGSAISATSDERTNTLIVVAGAEIQTEVDALIQRLDETPDGKEKPRQK